MIVRLELVQLVRFKRSAASTLLISVVCLCALASLRSETSEMSQRHLVLKDKHSGTANLAAEDKALLLTLAA